MSYMSELRIITCTTYRIYWFNIYYLEILLRKSIKIQFFDILL